MHKLYLFTKEKFDDYINNGNTVADYIDCSDICDGLFSSLYVIYLSQDKILTDKISFRDFNIEKIDNITLSITTPDYMNNKTYILYDQSNKYNSENGIYKDLYKICLKDTMLYTYENYKKGIKFILRSIVYPYKYIESINKMDVPGIERLASEDYINRSRVDTIFSYNMFIKNHIVNNFDETRCLSQNLRIDSNDDLQKIEKIVYNEALLSKMLFDNKLLSTYENEVKYEIEEFEKIYNKKLTDVKRTRRRVQKRITKLCNLSGYDEKIIYDKFNNEYKKSK